MATTATTASNNKPLIPIPLDVLQYTLRVLGEAPGRVSAHAIVAIEGSIREHEKQVKRESEHEPAE